MSVLPRFIWHTQRCGRCQSSRYLYGQRDTGHIPLTYFVGSSTCLARTSPRPAHLLPRPCPEAVQDKNLRGCLERSLHAGRCSSASMCTGRRASRRLSTRGGPRCGTGEVDGEVDSQSETEAGGRGEPIIQADCWAAV